MPTLTEIKLLQKSKVLHLNFDDDEQFDLPCEYLRINSPSADNKSHKEISDKEDVNIIGIDPVGNYAIKLIFDDGHDTGIYSWDYLYALANQLKESSR